MHTIETLLQSDVVLSAIAIVVAAVWSAVKSSEFWRAHKLDKYEAALGIVEIAVQKTYEDRVRFLKERNNGKLPEQERAACLERAVSHAITIGESHGIDVVSAVGSRQLLASEVQRAVNAAKR